MIVITGASKGIGNYLCETYGKIGTDVIGTYNSTQIESTNPKIKFVKLDTTNFIEIKKFVDENTAYLNNITLINCAGISYNSFAHKANPEQWKKVIEVNLLGTFYMINNLLPIMRNEGFGRIINFGSVLSDLPTPGASAYAASKSALFGMSKSIAIENANKGITINNISLGYSELGIIREVPEKYLEEIKGKIPLRKLCVPSDIFNTVEYLRNTEYITGTDIKINGGLI
jgi:NAD(P)-dependent dehydrogenase (short-subunit alcohol dehydrogenase family)